MFGWSSSTPQENEVIKSRYATIVQERGELFEDKIEALTAEDLLDIGKRKRKVKVFWYPVIALGAAFAMFFLIRESDAPLWERLFFVSFIMLPAIGTGLIFM